MTDDDLVLLARLLEKAAPDELDQAAEAAAVEFFAPGTVTLCADFVYVLADGLLSVRFAGRGKSIGYVSRGEYVRPEVSRNATIRAIRETRVLKLPGHAERFLVD